MHGSIPRRAVLLVLAAALVVLAAGCSRQVTEANAAIDGANDRLAEYTRAGVELEALMSRAESLPMDPAGAKQGIELTKRMTSTIEAQRVAATAARDQLLTIREMDVREEFKTYADKEIAVTETLLRQGPQAGAIVEDLGKVFEIVASGKGTQKDVEVIGKRIDEAGKQLSTLEAEGAKREKEAAEYFEAQALGGDR